CECDGGYMTHKPEVPTDICNYHKKMELTAFLLCFFVGESGVDWFYLAVNNPWYIVAGVLKLMTFRGLVIWWLVDWTRILVSAFPHGNGVEL
ncbi:hypothetical protein JKP88DRAFT_148405, partial [Tribonema minus]